MSNKKLFWVAFFILSCCEFAQVAYSKNTLLSSQTDKNGDMELHCQEKQDMNTEIVLCGESTSHSLPNNAR